MVLMEDQRSSVEVPFANLSIRVYMPVRMKSSIPTPRSHTTYLEVALSLGKTRSGRAGSGRTILAQTVCMAAILLSQIQQSLNRTVIVGVLLAFDDHFLDHKSV